MRYKCECGETKLGYPGEDPGAPYCCEDAWQYYNEAEVDLCPYREEVHGEEKECKCTPAVRYNCFMDT